MSQPETLTIPSTVPVVHTLRTAKSLAKTHAIVVWLRPSDGMITYVWTEAGRTRQKQRGRRRLAVAEIGS